jgi:hypothetical protein
MDIKAFREGPSVGRDSAMQSMAKRSVPIRFAQGRLFVVNEHRCPPPLVRPNPHSGTLKLDVSFFYLPFWRVVS